MKESKNANNSLVLLLRTWFFTNSTWSQAFCHSETLFLGGFEEAQKHPGKVAAGSRSFMEVDGSDVVLFHKRGDFLVI